LTGSPAYPVEKKNCVSKLTRLSVPMRIVKLLSLECRNSNTIEFVYTLNY